VDTLVTARFEMESIGIVDKGCHPDERALAFSAFAAQVVPGESPRDDMKEAEPCDGILPDLAGVSETMLWSLHNRASEACTSDRRSIMTSRAISVILWARSRPARSKSIGRYGRGSIAIRRGSSYPLGRV
jgi:hypothetical protein